MKKLPYMTCLLLAVLCAFPVSAAGLDPCRGGVLISREIKPFIRMVEQLENRLNMPLCRAFLDREGRVYSLDSRFKSIDTETWDFIVAVGPAALEHLVQRNVKTPVFYGMVLNPEGILADNSRWCGVSLDLFTSSRIQRIKNILPGINRMALLYHPDKNPMAEKVLKAFEPVAGMKSVPVKVFSESEIRPAVRKATEKADAIYFIPDRTVISPAIVKYIIKYGISRDTPSLGYNRFFHESGALLSFAVDYTRTGRQVADMVARFLETGECESSTPRADLLYSEKVSELLKIEVKEELLTNE